MDNLKLRRIFAGIGLVSVVVNIVHTNLPNAFLMLGCCIGVAYNDIKWRKNTHLRGSA